MANPNNFTTFLFFLIVQLLVLQGTMSLSRQASPNSLVLGLNRLTTSLPPPKPSTKRPTEALDMMEPLREVRDGYLITLNIGTPPQIIQVYMDTGSDLAWVPCGNLSFDCMDCDDYKSIRLMSNFSPSHSTTSYRDSCGSPFCIDIHSSDNSLDPCTISGCSLSTLIKGTCSRPCPSFAYSYGGGGMVVGTLSRDTLKVHGPSGITKEIPRFCFGCVGSTYHEPIGIAGFGRGPLSFPSQLGFLRKGFSHCFLPFKYANNPNISSPLLIGDLALTSKDGNMQFTPMLKSPMFPNYYYLGLEAITIGNVSASQVPISLKEFDSEGNGGMLIDSGTTYTHLPYPLYSGLLATLQSLIAYPRADDMEARTGFDLCYKVPCPNNTFGDDHDLGGFPPITFHFLNNVNLALPPGNHFYAVSAPSNSTGVKCLMFQGMDEGEDSGDNINNGPAGVFGSFQQQNLEVVYDLERERIGFQPMDCASSSASQGLHRN